MCLRGLFYWVRYNAAYVEQGYREGYTQGVADGLSKVNIQYTYHVHTGSAGTTANGCYTTAVYHNHTDSCYTTCGGTANMTSDDANYRHYKCNICGKTSKMDINEAISHNHTYIYPCNKKIFICSKSTSTVDKYTLGCGKDEHTIESATIIY